MKPKTVGKTLTAMSILFIIAAIIFTPQVKAIHHYNNAQPPMYKAPIPTLEQYNTQYSPLVENLFNGEADPEKYEKYTTASVTQSMSALVNPNLNTKQTIERLNKHNAFDNSTSPSRIVNKSIETVNDKKFNVHKTYEYQVIKSYDHPAIPVFCDTVESWEYSDYGYWQLSDTGYNKCVHEVDVVAVGHATQMNTRNMAPGNHIDIGQSDGSLKRPGMKSFAPERPFAPYGSEFAPLTSGEYFDKKPGLFDVFK